MEYNYEYSTWNNSYQLKNKQIVEIVIVIIGEKQRTRRTNIETKGKSKDEKEY